ncbi:MAG: FliA/WhiG family RNA polymerase sigma factor [Desulfosarcina sp.]|nr:FliA/WhiG family RNA polymerase sigma factor [Desulfobacterales bacterium]
MKAARKQTMLQTKAVVPTRDHRMTEYLPHVKRIVNRMAIHLPATVDIEDLYNVGVIGLIQAIDRFDPQRDNKFITYATHRIRGAVLSELRSRDFLSRSNRRKIREMDSTYAMLEQKLGRDVDDHEIAAAMQIDLRDLDNIKGLSSISFISFEEMGFSESRDKGRFFKYLADDSVDALSITNLGELKVALAKAIEKLPEKEKIVLSLYYFDQLNMKETGKVLNITESRVSQIHSQAVIHLRNKLRRERIIEN